tara:strand:- start:2008 stop:2535 length:528 start_codon:yes stop_codon:yes gene_type:complete
MPYGKGTYGSKVGRPKKKSPVKKYGAKSPVKKYGAKSPAMKKKKSPMKRALVGKQNRLPENIKKAIKAAPETKKKSPATKKKSPMKMVKSFGNAGMVGKAGTTKKATAKKSTGKKQGYNARLDESLGMRRGKASTKTQSYKARRDESKGAKKAAGKRAYSGNKSSAQGKRLMRKR